MEKKHYKDEADLKSKVMTVDKMIDVLQHLKKEGHGEDIVVLSSDAEGNNFSPLPAELGFSWGSYYRPECTWAGETRSADDFEDENEKKEYLEGEIYKCVTLWPTN